MYTTVLIINSHFDNDTDIQMLTENIVMLGNAIIKPTLIPRTIL